MYRSAESGDREPSSPIPSPVVLGEGTFAYEVVPAYGSLPPARRREGLGTKSVLLDGRLDLLDEGVERLLSVGATVDVLERLSPEGGCLEEGRLRGEQDLGVLDDRVERFEEVDLRRHLVDEFRILDDRSSDRVDHLPFDCRLAQMILPGGPLQEVPCGALVRRR